MSDLSPLSGVKRKLDFGAVRAAFDPERTLRSSIFLTRVFPSLAGDGETEIPADSIAAVLEPASPLPPEIIAVQGVSKHKARPVMC
jgi:hypothetical protein